MKNILTFDVEEWYDANYPEINPLTVDYKKSNLENELGEILDLCDKYKTKATFFILGRVANQNPELVRKIKDRGHEVASHGYEHKLVYNLSPDLFRNDLEKSVRILEGITGEKVLGFRAPSWSLNEKTSWVYPILAGLNLKYSASVFPIKSSLYGMPDAPRFPYLVKAGNKDILEIPTSTLRLFGRNVPFSGGAYFRIIPECFVSYAIKKVNKEGNPVIVYLHPREIDREAPRLKLSFKNRFGHYFGAAGAKNKLEEILKRFNFGSIEEELLPKYSL